jgi:hypothetical protein
MAQRMRMFAIVGLAAGVAACSMLAGLTEDYRYSGTTSSNEGGDGAGSDGRLPDGFVPGEDGGTDALAIPDGAKFCDTISDASLDLCEDFELSPQTAGLPKDWARLQNDVDASVKVMPNIGVGMSVGLDVDSISTSSGSRNTFIVRTLPATNAPAAYLLYEIDFDFKLLESAVNYVVVGVLNFTNATPEDHGVAAYPSNLVVSRLGGSYTNAVPDPAPKAWHHVHMTLQHTTPGTSFNRRIAIDGETDASIVDNSSGISTANTTVTELRIGIFYTTGGAGRIHAQFDNIVVRRSK